MNRKIKQDEDWKEEAINRAEKAVHKMEERIQHVKETERNIMDYHTSKKKSEAPRKECDWMEEIDRTTLAVLTVEIILVAYFILALLGYVPLF